MKTRKRVSLNIYWRDKCFGQKLYRRIKRTFAITEKRNRIIMLCIHFVTCLGVNLI
jgi:hypothetical protein